MYYKLIKSTIFITTFLTFSSVYFLFVFYKENSMLYRKPKVPYLFNNATFNENFLVFTPGCRIPKYDPYDFTVKRYFVKTPYKYDCGNKKTVFKVQKNGVVTVDEDALFKQYQVQRSDLHCYYSAVKRKNSGRKPDDTLAISKQYDMIFDLPMDEDCILLECKAANRTLKSLLLLTPLKTKVEERCKSTAKDSGEKLSVVIVGIDSISKLNFFRYFKRTLALLRNDSRTIELNGFVKVADNTYPNLIPFLTGRHRNHYKSKERRFSFYDDVDFVWKRYSEMGYRTLFSEDAPDMGTFVLNRRGFKLPPTDYYSRPFSVAVEALGMRSRTQCIGNRLEMQSYIDYLKNFLSTMEDRLVFSFTFLARLTHDVFKYAGYADKPSVELISFLNDTGVLNRSLFVFFSDHGIRFGDIRRTYIGKIEERMPFVFLSFPDWFMRKYPKYAKSLEVNQNRLTTHFDIHATLLHLLELGRDPFYTLHGQSLLTEISPERTCADAMISKHWCTCQAHKIVPTDDPDVRKATMSAIRKLNRILKPYLKYCAPLKMDKVLDARIAQPNENLVVEPAKDYLITFQVIPSAAIFEATVQVKNKQFTVSDDISRINRYGNASYCVTDPLITKYCFCKKALISI